MESYQFDDLIITLDTEGPWDFSKVSSQAHFWLVLSG